MDVKPTCNKCNIEMGKAGFAKSGSKEVQRYRCNNCGATTTKNTDNSNHNRRIFYEVTDLEYAKLNLRALKAGMSIQDYSHNVMLREH